GGNKRGRSRDGLADRLRLEERRRRDGVGGPGLLHAESLRPGDSTAIDDRDARSGHVVFRHTLRHCPTHGRSAFDGDGRAQPLKYAADAVVTRSEEHTSELQSRGHLVCRLLLEKKKTL